mgnify:CR=1 FL=1
MDVLARSSQFNNEAIRLLASNLFEAAEVYFEEGILTVSNLLELTAKGGNISGFNSNNQLLTAAPPIQLSMLQVPLPSDPKRAAIPDNTKHSPIFLLYTPTYGDATPEFMKFSLAILLFNYGVAVHREATCGETSILQRALSLYNQSMKILLHLCSQIDCYEIVHATLKNQSDVYYKMEDFKSMQTTMDRLLLLTTHAKGCFRPLPSAAASA